MLPTGSKIPAFFQKVLYYLYPSTIIDFWSKTYGDTFRLLGQEMPPTINFSSPEALKTIFNATTEIESTQTSFATQPLKILTGSNSIIFLEPEAHRRERKLIMPIFHKERLLLYGDLIIDLTKKVIKNNAGKTFLIRNFTKEITLKTIVNVVFGNADSQDKEKLQQLMTSLVTTFDNKLFLVTLVSPFLQKPWFKIWKDYKEIQANIDRLIFSEIAKRKSKPNSQLETDILSLLMSAQEAETGFKMSDEAIRDEIMTLIFAGFETTAAALSWALYWVYYLPDVKDKLECELINQDLKPSLIKLPYLNAVVNEVLRIYPIAIGAFQRTVVAPITVSGYDLPIGTKLFINIYQAHHRPEVYPNPFEFKPERFLERNFSPYEFLPFGGGDRLCLGSALAQYEIKLALSTIIKTTNAILIDPSPAKPVPYGTTSIPPRNLKLKILSVSI